MPAQAGAPFSTECTYVVRLRADLGPGAALAGRLEHVASGRRHDFDSGTALLSCLILERALAFGSGDPPESDALGDA